MTEDQKPYEIKVGQHGKGCECSKCQPERDCHNCGRPETGQVCTMSKTDIETCLKNPSRPFWKPRQSKNCRTCGKRVNQKDLKCPLDTDVSDECVRDFWSMWEPVSAPHYSSHECENGKPRRTKEQIDQLIDMVRKEWSPCQDTIKKNDHDVDEMVNHPGHYTRHPVEVIDIIKDILTRAYGPDGYRAYCLGNEIKYRMRAGLKGDPVQDIEKAMKYMEFREAVDGH